MVDGDGYSTYGEAIKQHPHGQPRQVIYRDRVWPLPYVPTSEAGPTSRPVEQPTESLRTVLERTWEAWENKYGDSI